MTIAAASPAAQVDPYWTDLESAAAAAVSTEESQ